MEYKVIWEHSQTVHGSRTKFEWIGRKRKVKKTT